MAFSFFLDWPLSIPSPSYGWYRADSEYWNCSTNKLLDISGNGNYATTSSDIVLGTGSGNGATASIKYLTGGTSSTVVWPIGSIPITFTICSVTRYSDERHLGRILAGRTINWYHGHHLAARGVAYYDGLKTDHISVGLLTDWLIMCGKNSGSIPYNILVDGVAVGVSEGGYGYLDLCINLDPAMEYSDWTFRELMIWNTALSDADMVIASTALRSSLLYGMVRKFLND